MRNPHFSKRCSSSRPLNLLNQGSDIRSTMMPMLRFIILKHLEPTLCQSRSIPSSDRSFAFVCSNQRYSPLRYSGKGCICYQLLSQPWRGKCFVHRASRSTLSKTRSSCYSSERDKAATECIVLDSTRSSVIHHRVRFSGFVVSNFIHQI